MGEFYKSDQRREIIEAIEQMEDMKNTLDAAIALAYDLADKCDLNPTLIRSQISARKHFCVTQTKWESNEKKRHHNRE